MGIRMISWYADTNLLRICDRELQRQLFALQRDHGVVHVGGLLHHSGHGSSLALALDCSTPSISRPSASPKLPASGAAGFGRRQLSAG